MNKITMSGVGENDTAMREFEKISDAVWPVILRAGDGGACTGAGYLSTPRLLAFVLPAANFCKQ